MANVPRGRFVWYELMTTDPDAAQAFYGNVVGWTAEPWMGGPEPYTVWKNGDSGIGGVMNLPDEAVQGGAPPHWLAHIAVPDVDASVERATSKGGTLYAGPMDVPTVGRFAVLGDPQGAVFAVFAPEGEAPGHDGMARPGEFSWHELTTSDHQAAFDFYSDLVGWEKTGEFDMGEMGMYQMYGQGEATYGGMMDQPPGDPMPPRWLFYVRVADLDATIERVRNNGGQLLHGPMEVPGGDHVAICMDPQGAAFALHEHNEA